MIDGRLRRRETSTRWVSHSSESFDDPGHAWWVCLLCLLWKDLIQQSGMKQKRFQQKKVFIFWKKEKITERNIRNTSAEEAGYCGNTLTMKPACSSMWYQTASQIIEMSAAGFRSGNLTIDFSALTPPAFVRSGDQVTRWPPAFVRSCDQVAGGRYIEYFVSATLIEFWWWA